jgi:D-alanyl-lipoteichoic acid acyltransferase DltB (MBOAT superfamily)
MTFASLTFPIFVVIIFIAYWMARRRRVQNGILVLASYLFYGWWDYRFCALMLISSLVDFVIGWLISVTERQSHRKLLLFASLACNLGLLATFKYFNFFIESLTGLADTLGWHLNTGTLEIILPVGISFYTFQTLSYTIDIYRKQIEATDSVLDYLAFVSFFPQLVAGPIERASRLLPQFTQQRSFDYERATDGCRQILWGFFKKVMVADYLAQIVDPAYANPDALNGPALAFATICFAFQIYCDFSAYSDIAIGTAKLFGIQLMQNFAYPYFSQSITEFWRRWHISLSTWFRDYVYVPLGGSRVSAMRRKSNVLVTFLVSGLWHGPAWTFVFWGGMNGMAAAVGAPRRYSNKDTPGGERLIPDIGTAARITSTFVLVCFCWIFFRAESLVAACRIVSKILGDLFTWSAYMPLLSRIVDDPLVQHAVAVIVGLLLVEWLQRRRPHPLHLSLFPRKARWAVYTVLFWGMLDFMQPSQEFIYFAF